MNSVSWFALCLVCLTGITSPATAAASTTAEAKPTAPRVTVLFDSESHREGLETDWGYACIIEGLEKTVLFDTGNDGKILLANMDRLVFDPKDVDVVFLSHDHGDHTRGLGPFLMQNPDIEGGIPAYFPKSFAEEVRSVGATAKIVGDPTTLFAGVHTTGEMGRGLIEQSLILETGSGLTVITGCAHPGIVEIVRRAKELRDDEVRMIVGGFHLMRTSGTELALVVEALQKEGVKCVAPSHCTGEEATELFRKTWGDAFSEGRAGAVIELE
jgi:7,8-dihydropterin-6-yl-methyl-4-(beta-D-ribofuranosyl)aminobenzene 5'-phosphate synthase